MLCRACLHLVTSCIFSDRISIWFVKMFPFTLGHINVSLTKTDVYPFKSCAICTFNRVLINESKTDAAFYSLSAHFNIRPQQERARHQPVKDRLVSLLWIRMIVCWASVTLFHSRQFACRLAEETPSYSSSVTLVALARSYLTVTCHIAYKTLSHVYYFNILGGVKFAYVVSTTRCIYTCPVLSGMLPRPPSEVVWAIEFISVSKAFQRAFTPGLFRIG